MLQDYLKTQTRKLSVIFKELSLESPSYSQLLEIVSRFYGFRNYAVSKKQDFSVMPLMQWKAVDLFRAKCPWLTEDEIESWFALKQNLLVSTQRNMFDSVMKEHNLSAFKRKVSLSDLTLERIDNTFGIHNLSCIGKIPFKRCFDCGDLAQIQDTGNPDMEGQIFEVVGIAGVGLISVYVIRPVTGYQYRLENNMGDMKTWQTLTIAENLLYPVHIKNSAMSNHT